MAQALQILGIYRPQISAETWAEQRAHTSEQYTQAHFAGLVLIEAVFANQSTPLHLGKFGQMDIEHPDDPHYMQVGYDEALLSSDGETLIDRGQECVRGTGPLRFTVFLHFYDPERPIQWQDGEIVGPPVQDVPSRLSALVPYTACT